MKPFFKNNKISDRELIQHLNETISEDVKRQTKLAYQRKVRICAVSEVSVENDASAISTGTKVSVNKAKVDKKQGSLLFSCRSRATDTADCHWR